MAVPAFGLGNSIGGPPIVAHDIVKSAIGSRWPIVSAVHPVRCKAICDRLLEEFGICVQPINYPAVPKGTEHFRLAPIPQHTKADINRLLDALTRLTGVNDAALREVEQGAFQRCAGPRINKSLSCPPKEALARRTGFP